MRVRSSKMPVFGFDRCVFRMKFSTGWYVGLLKFTRLREVSWRQQGSRNSQLVNVIKSTGNKTRGHNLKLIKQTCSVEWMPLNIRLLNKSSRLVNVWKMELITILLLAHQHCPHLNHCCKNMIFTAQCTLVQLLGLGIACRLSVRLSVCNVGGLWSHRLEILETNCTDN